MANFLYVVLSGRFRSVITDANGERRLVEENGKGRSGTACEEGEESMSLFEATCWA